VWHAALPVDVTERSLWRHGDFMKLWTGQTVSELGSVVTRTALPFAAVITLHATALQVGILVASASIAVLLVGLFAGALVDRSRRRPLMIAADAIRAVLLLSIPFAAVAGSLGSNSSTWSRSSRPHSARSSMSRTAPTSHRCSRRIDCSRATRRSG
jgi:MFS family permease